MHSHESGSADLVFALGTVSVFGRSRLRPTESHCREHVFVPAMWFTWDVGAFGACGCPKGGEGIKTSFKSAKCSPKGVGGGSKGTITFKLQQFCSGMLCTAHFRCGMHSRGSPNSIGPEAKEHLTSQALRGGGCHELYI